MFRGLQLATGSWLESLPELNFTINLILKDTNFSCKKYTSSELP